jgi:K(+)-stimulated pyrophosphate-energized sodium pump
MYMALLIALAGIPSLISAAAFYWLVSRESPGTPRMQEIASFIREGANAYLRRQFQTIAYFIVGLAALLLIVMWPRWQTAFGFIVGALLAQLAIFLGMNAAVRANVRTTQAARTSAGKALVVAFRGGSVMGLIIVAFNLLGIAMLSILFGVGPHDPENVSLLVGFGFGSSLASLFAQVGGGIFTKAADVGADLVGKIEARIPEDDPRNPGVIADLVGDNVGDVAGRGADLFESGSDNLVATMIVGIAFIPQYGWAAVMFPLLSRAIGALGDVIGVLAVREAKGRSPVTSLNIGIFTTAIFSLLGFYALGQWVMKDIRIFYCLTLGLLSALGTALIVQYYTGIDRTPVKKIAEASQSGPAINLMSGFSWGMESAVLPKIMIALANLAAYYIMGGGIAGFFGVTAATLGITEMKGIIMSGDAFGPIVDNASGIAEMAGLSEEVRESAHALDAAGNITKAITKGYSMSCALMTSVVILFAYMVEAARLQGIEFTHINDIIINLAHPVNITAIMIGSTIPFLFTAQTVRAVEKTAFKMIEEIRRQFREIPGLLAGDAKPDYARCVDISTRNALREMVAPTVFGVLFPIAVGFTLGVWPLAAYLIGVKIIGATLAIFMFNSGAAWDNAKKYVEAGHLGGKGTETHAASVIGDTFGDPLKDVAGPSLHILIKLQNILAITLLPLFVAYSLKWP